MTSAPTAFTACDTAAGLGRSAKEHAPTAATLIDILNTKRRELLEELRNIEQTVEALEANPGFEGTFQRVQKILQRGRY